ncbi:leucine-rich repeat extensin-like protein 1 isoform X1 [Quercus robur]|uniref:leucine-rich repeat extensin-like protein 1 isoform X1 n=1 Tax=Quercus robur TaxID=38942 RepID=UPI002162FA0D|nr:leucine-rich repeat extensin-like protein 1 isoform X1 [Quercus robur]
MSNFGIQGQLLEVTVVGCNKLKDTEWISRQDPYVCLEYGSTKFRTRTCTDGHKTPVFQEKFVFSLIEGLREINVAVWNSNTLTVDDFIGSGKVQLVKVLSQGFDDTTWPLQTKTGRYAGEVRLIMHYSNATKPASNCAPSAPPYGMPPVPQAPVYPTNSAYPTSSPYPNNSAYPTSSPYPTNSAYPTSSPYPTSSAYPTSSPYSSYPPNSAGYPPSLYSAPPPSTYPPPPYPPTSAYPPPPYPPPPQASPYYPPGPYSGAYPPPRY